MNQQEQSNQGPVLQQPAAQQAGPVLQPQPQATPPVQQQSVAPAAEPAPAQQGTTPPGQQQAPQSPQMPDANALLTEISNLKAQIANMPVAQQPAQQQQDMTLQERTFFESDDTFNNAIGSRENFNKIANAIASHGVEHLLKVLPSLINNRVTQSISMYDATKDFFQNNADLAPYEQALSREVATLQSARPGMPIQQTLNDAAAILRQKMNLPVQQAPAYNPFPQQQQTQPQVQQQQFVSQVPVQGQQTVYVPGAPPPVPGANNGTGFQPPPTAAPGGNNKYANVADEVADTFGIK